jgi:hypothetical protein
VLRLIAITGALLVVVATSGLGAARAATPRPVTVTSFAGFARELDVAAGRVAWIDSAWALRMRSLRSGVETKILYTNPYNELPSTSPAPRLLLEPRRSVWLSTRATGMFDIADRVFLAAGDSPRAQRIASTGRLDGFDGGYVTGVAGDSSGFSYGIVVVKKIGENPETYQVSGGGVWAAAGAAPRRVPGAAPSIVLAYAAGRVAIAPVDTSARANGRPVAAGPLEIRNATTGSLVSGVSPGGAVRAAALSPTTLTLLVGSRVERYDVASGMLLGSTTVPGDIVAELRISGERIVFRRTHSIGLLDAATGRVATLTATSWRPTGVAIDGRTVAWAETRRIAPGEPSKKTFAARIRALTLPAG